jgi:hypothetical protein
MKRLDLYKYYVVRSNTLININKHYINNNESVLYIDTTPSTPSDIEFTFSIFERGNFNVNEISYDIGYLYEQNSKNKLISISTEFKRNQLINNILND